MRTRAHNESECSPTQRKDTTLVYKLLGVRSGENIETRELWAAAAVAIRAVVAMTITTSSHFHQLGPQTRTLCYKICTSQINHCLENKEAQA